MARVDEDPEERDQEPLQLSQLVDCGMCGVAQEVFFRCDEGVYTLEDMIDQPETTHTCVSCGYESEVTFSGWVINEEA